MVKILGSVKCFYCGHISGSISIETTAEKRRQRFMPRPGYEGALPRPHQAIRCERCFGPVFLDESEKPMAYEMPFVEQQRTARRPLKKSA